MADLLSAAQTAQAMAANDAWADRLAWRPYAPAIATLMGATDSAPGGAPLALATCTYQARHALAADGIIGPRTWTRVSHDLAPPDSLTGVLPADAPAVPDGFEEIVATFGDPRPLLSSDGSITNENEALWERQILAKGTLPFPVPVDANHPEAGTKKTFYAHRELISSFVSVFSEIERLGLRGLIRSWDGVYNFRPIRGTTSRISLHAFGAAIDLNASTNPLGGEGDMDARIIDVFTHFGFFWGGNFQTRPDPMHFQYATGY